jgi:hypothetical protein
MKKELEKQLQDFREEVLTFQEYQLFLAYGGNWWD